MKRVLLLLVAATSIFLHPWLASPLSARTIGLVFDDSGSMRHSIQLPTFGVQLLVSTLDGRQGRDRFFSIRLSQFENAFPGPLRPVLVGGRSVTVANFGMRPAEIRAENVDRIFKAVKPGATLVTTHDLRTEDRIEGTIEGIRQGWTDAHANTPYEPIEVMLEWLARETGDGEQAYLVVVTDGAFYDGVPGAVPPVATLRQSYQEYKRRMKGPLEVLFLFIDHGETVNGRSLQQIAEQDQQVYTTLIDVFGGDRSDAVFVHNHAELKEALIHYIAKISSTEIDRSNSVVRRNGSAIEFDMPFSVTRVITLWTGPEGAVAPRPVGNGLGASTKLHFSPEMKEADRLSAGLTGDVTQLLLDPPLSPGHHRLEFSRPVGDDMVVLFRSEVGLRWKLIDPAGHEIRPDPRGAVEVSRDRKYKIVVEVQDRIPGGGTVPPSRLPNAVVSATMVDPSGTARAIELTPSDGDHGFIGDAVFSTEGRHTVTAVLRLPGFVTSRAEMLSVNVVERAFNLVMDLERAEPCPWPDCPEGVLPVTVTGGRAARSVVGRVRVRAADPPLRHPGRFHLQVENLEPGIAIVDPEQRPVSPDAEYALTPGASVYFTVIREPGWKPRPSGGPSAPDTMMKTVASAPLEGQAALAFRIRPNAPDPLLHYRGHDQDPTGTQPLVVHLPGSDDGSHTFAFSVQHAFGPPSPSNLSVAPGGGLAGSLVGTDLQVSSSGDDQAGEYAFAVRPHLPWWCHCFLGLALHLGATPNVPIEVTYDPHDGRRTSSAEAPLRFTDADWSFLSLWSGCTWFLILLLLLAYAARVGYCFAAAQRFPVQSRMYLFETGYTESVARSMRKSIWSDLWTALGLRIPRHWCRLDALIVEAEGNQLRLRTTASEWPDYIYLRRGASLQDLSEQMNKRRQAPRAVDATIPVTWGSSLEEPIPGGRKVVFVKSSQQVTQAVRTRTVEA